MNYNFNETLVSSMIIADVNIISRNENLSKSFKRVNIMSLVSYDSM